MGWGEFAAAYIAFFLSHALPIRPPIRQWLEARLGRSGFTLAYSVLSIAILGWLIGAAGRAPYVSLWPSASWQNHVPVVVMVPVCLIIALSVARPNPFSFGGARNDSFDPAHPGIVRLTRHPLLLALALWAAAHLVPNGDLAHVFLFGTFAVFALLGGHLIDARKLREMGTDWQRLRKAVTQAPLFSRSVSGDVALRLAAGMLLYLGLIWLHPVIFGVSPLP